MPKKLNLSSINWVKAAVDFVLLQNGTSTIGCGKLFNQSVTLIEENVTSVAVSLGGFLIIKNGMVKSYGFDRNGELGSGVDTVANLEMKTEHTQVVCREDFTFLWSPIEINLKGIFLIVGIVIAIVVIFIACVVIFTRCKKNKKRYVKMNEIKLNETNKESKVVSW
jgi:hypothetical protein